MRFYEHKNKDEYYKAQVETNKKKINNVWVTEYAAQLVANDVKNRVGVLSFGICHGVRNAWEVHKFRKLLGINIIGTDISPTANRFKHAIEWDFHNVQDSWIGKTDFIYSNSFDHSYNPEVCLDTWMRCVRRSGACYIHWSKAHEKDVSSADCFGATKEEYRQMFNKKYNVVEELCDKQNRTIFVIKHKPKKYFIDCGANNSCSARIFRKQNDPNNEYHIYSFEIEPDHFKFFDGIENLTLIKKAVWVEDGEADFYRDRMVMRAGGSLIKEKTSADLDKENPLRVKTIDFSCWVKKNLDKNDYIILKMDIEGAEYKTIYKMIIDGSFEYIDKLLIEWHWRKIGMSKEQHEELINKISIPMEKWTGIEDARKILGINYLRE